MTVVTTHRLGEPCWVDYAASDLPRAQEFYTSLFGWTAETGGGEYGGYVTFRRDGHLVAGMGEAMEGARPDAWLTYLLVEDADAGQRAAEGAGAQVLAPVMTVGDQGRLAVVTDPGGAVVGLWEPDQHRGFELVAEVGGLSWHELYARDYAAQTEFYERVFGWQTKVLGDTADFRYLTFGDVDDATGGVYDANGMLPPEVPSHWVVYFGVEDATAAVARVAELGGTAIRDPWDSEFGRFAQVTDPFGGLFFLHEVEGSIA